MDAPERARKAFSAWRDAVCDDWYADDPHLHSLVAHHGNTGHARALALFGPISAQIIDPLVRENNRDEHLPRLRRFDGLGNRTESVDFHPSYHEIGRLSYGTGVMSRYADPGREFETLSLLYLLAQNGEAGHTCPMACTAGLIKLLQRSGGHEAWLTKLLDADYDTHFHGAQFLTEVQGGSDVGANALQAVPEGDHWRLTGEKWFCSVIDADLFLVTARIQGGPNGTQGLGAFVVPRLLPDNSINDFRVRRLKFKLGTRSMASGETDFDGAWAVQVGDFKATVEVVLNTSRLYNAVCSAGCLQRASREAFHYADTRLAFGQSILQFPAVARIIARLRSETYAIRSITFLLAAMTDQQATGNPDPSLVGAYRMLVNLNKYWTSNQATLGIRDAIEILGGNGAIEEFTVLPRLLRDSIVCEAWEGGHNVLCAQLLRDSQRFGLHQPMFALLRRLGGDPARLEDLEARWERLLSAPPEYAATHIRDVVEALRIPAQCAALRAEARSHGFDPLLPTVIEHLETLHAPGWDAMDDATLLERVRLLSQPPHTPA
ncbi:MAG: acyl-CoA dehydrogenase [Rhodobacterales bacterium]|nr:acyl-CoA dehydrogenase [Rhodobacterales bacterium]